MKNLSVLAHDLKQPLSVLAAQSYFLRSKAGLDRQKQLELANRIDTQSAKLSSMIDTISDSFKLQSENYIPTTVILSLADFWEMMSDSTLKSFFQSPLPSFPSDDNTRVKVDIVWLKKIVTQSVNILLPVRSTKIIEAEIRQSVLLLKIYSISDNGDYTNLSLNSSIAQQLLENILTVYQQMNLPMDKNTMIKDGQQLILVVPLESSSSIA